MISIPTILRRASFFLGLAVASTALSQPAVTIAVTGNQITSSGAAVLSLTTGVGLLENNVTFTLTWDPTVLQYVSAVRGTTPSSYTPNASQVANGRLSGLVAMDPDVAYPAGSTQLLTINFTALSASVSTNLSFVDGSTLTPVSARNRVFNTAGNNLTAATFTNKTIAVSLAPTAPAITTSPVSQTIASGQNVIFTAAASGNPAPTFKWQKDTVDISNGGRVSGATTSTLTITGALTTDAGSYRAVATNASGAVTSTAATLTVNKVTQGISFSQLENKTFGNSTFTLAATASSGLALSYSSATPTVATVAGNVVTIVGAGSSVITASQAGNSEYDAATNATQTLTVNKAAATVTLADLTPTYNNSPKAVTATTSPVGLPVTITYGGSATAPTAAGSYAVVATITSLNYAGSANGTLVIGKANQTITFGALSQKLFSDPAFTLSATASSTLPVSYASSSAAVATVSGNTVTIKGVGTTTITASQAGDANFNPATATTQDLTVANALQTITFGAITARTFAPNDTLTLGATASSTLPVSYTSSNSAVATVVGSTVTVVGAGATTITAKQAGNANFGPAVDVTQLLTINKAAATVSLGGLAATYDGTVKNATATTTPSGLNVTFTYAGSATAPSAAGTYAVVGTINDTNYAGNATGSLVIAKAAQTITFNALTPVTFGGAPFDLTATTTSPLTVLLVSSNPTVATISGKTVTIIGAGETTISASQDGNSNYSAAASVSRTLTVNKAAASVALSNLAQTYSGTAKNPTATTALVASLPVTFAYSPGGATAPINVGSYGVTATINHPNYAGSSTGTLEIAKAAQTIAFAGPLNKAFDESPVALTGTATSGLGLSYVSSDTTVATVNGTSLTLLKTGVITITASQAGDTNFLPATPVAVTLTVVAASQTVTFAGTELASKTFGNPAFTLTAASNRSLTVNFTSSNTNVATVAGNTVTIIGAGTTTITAKQPGTADFGAAPDVPRTLVVAKAAATATLGGLAQTYNTTPRPVSATTVPNGLNVTFTYAGSGTVPTNVGSYAVVGTIEENNYSGSIAGTLVVAKADQTITFVAPSSKLVGSGSFALGATANSGLPVTYVSATPAVATIAVGNAIPVGIGSSIITASQVGSANYNAAPDVTRTLTVNPIAPVILSTPPVAATAVQGRNFLFGPITINKTPATFTATGLPDGLTVNSTLGTISGIPTETTKVGTPATIVLTVTNVTGSDVRTISLTVGAPPPVITSPASATVRAGTPFTFNVVATNAPTGYAATGLPSGLTIDTGTGVISGTPAAGTANTYTVKLTATNASGSVSQPLVLVIDPPLNAPVYTGPANLSGTQGSSFSFTPAFGTVTAAYALAFVNPTTALPTGLTFTAATGVIAGTPTQVGSFAVTLSATNAGGTTTVPLKIVINSAATAPVITSSSIAPGARVGTVFGFQLTSTGTPTASAYSAIGLPAGLTLTSGTGAIGGTPAVFGTFSVTVSATNTVGTGPTSILTISVAPSLLAPVITSSPVVNYGQVGQTFTPFNLTASPAATSFAVTNGTLPAGLSLNTATGAITGTPLAAAVGKTTVWFAGTKDSVTGLATSVLFTIAPAAATPIVNSNGTATAQVGLPFQYVITANNGPLTAFAATGLPAWLLLNGTTGVLSGIPSEATTTAISIALAATNLGGTGSPKTLLLSVAPAPATPIITSTLTATGRVGTAFTYQITASETPTSFVASGLPEGLSLNATTGAISGSPTISKTYVVALKGANVGGLGAPSSLVIDIAPAANAPAITSAAAASGQIGVAFTYQIVATNPPILSYGVTGALPSGLELNTATGALTGTPSADPRSYLVQLTATNAGGTSLPQPLAINVAPALGVPAVTTPLYVDATVGVDFAFTITATNLTGTAPYAPPILLDAVGLPSGLAVNPATGVILGKPTASGITVASLVATNAAGTGPTRELKIRVLPALTAPVVGGASVALGQVNVPFTYQVVASNTPTSYGVVAAPAWLALDTATGAMTGVPTAPGPVSVQLTATNAADTSSPATLELFISPAANTPVITSTRTATGTIGVAFSYTPVAAPVATSYLASGLPGGLGLNSATGVIGGTPNISGTFKVILTPANTNGIGAPVTIVITILPNVTFGGG